VIGHDEFAGMVAKALDQRIGFFDQRQRRFASGFLRSSATVRRPRR
jgi:hypothetical protein